MQILDGAPDLAASPPALIFRTYCPAFTVFSPPLCTLTLSSSTSVSTSVLRLPCERDNILPVPLSTTGVRLSCDRFEHYVKLGPGAGGGATVVDVVLVRTWEPEVAVKVRGCEEQKDEGWVRIEARGPAWA